MRDELENSIFKDMLKNTFKNILLYGGGAILVAYIAHCITFWMIENIDW